MNMEFRIENDKSAEVLKAAEDAVLKFFQEAGLHLVGEAQDELQNDPRRVDTGLLKNSITFALDGQATHIRNYKADTGDGAGTYSGTAPEEKGGDHALYIGTNVEYAVYVHEGTRRMTPNRFIKNAIERNKDQLKSKLKEALENA